jgi:multiple sugar transport system substrate-binding protein
MKNIYSRRQILEKGLGSLTGLSLLGLAGCQTSSDIPSVPIQNNIALSMVFWGPETRNKLTRQAIELFQKRRPTITISSQYSDFNTYFDKLDAKIKDGKTPDLIQMDMRWLSLYVRRGVLLDLTQLIYNQTIDLSDYDPLLLYASKANNTVYGIPMGGNYQAMYYNEALINKAGIGPIPKEMTWNEFAAYCTELSKALGNGIYGSSNNAGNITNFEGWIRSRGKELYTYDGKLGFALEDVTAWYSYWDNLSKKGGCLPLDMQASFDILGTPVDSSLIKGKAVFYYSYSNLFEAYQKATTLPLGLAMPPRGSTPNLYLKPSMLISIAAQTQYPIEAASFISFICNDLEGVKALNLERGMPGSAQARAVLSPQLTPIQRTITAYVEGVSRSDHVRLKAVLDPPGAGKVSNLLRDIAKEKRYINLSATDKAKTLYEEARMILV